MAARKETKADSVVQARRYLIQCRSIRNSDQIPYRALVMATDLEDFLKQIEQAKIGDQIDILAVEDVVITPPTTKGSKLLNFYAN